MSNLRQCNECVHNEGNKCARLRAEYFNGKKCDARKQKYTARIRIINNTNKVPVFYSNMER